MNESIQTAAAEGKNGALELVTRAMPALKEIDSLYEQAVAIKQQFEARKTAVRDKRVKSANTIGMLCSFAAFLVLDIIFYLLMALLSAVAPESNAAFMLMTVFAVLALIFSFAMVPKIVKKKMLNSIPEVDRLAREQNKEINKISAQIEDKAVKNAAAINALPRDYRYYDAAVFFERALTNGMADSMKEALSEYENHLHRQRMEAMNRRTLMINQRQSEMLAVIEQNSKAAARDSSIAAAFSVMNFLQHM